jgi:hypothetical protein
VTVYATAEQLAEALRIAVTVKNQAALDRCVAAASARIDQYCDRPATNPMPVPTPALVEQECISFAVELWKAPDAAFGAVGFDNTGVLTVNRDTFGRHAKILIEYKVGFGVA